MDPRQQNNQSDHSSGQGPPIPQKGPLNSNQAAELIRQQLNSIYTSQESHVEQSSAQSQHFNPYQSIQEPNTTPQPQNPQATQPAMQQQAQPNPSPYYNPYHNQKAAGNHQQQTPASETETPGGANYRKNYSTFAVPGAAPQPQPPVAEMASPQPADQTITGSVATQRPTIGDLKQSVIDRVQSNSTKKNHSKLKPLFVALAIGLTFLAINYNQVAIAQVKQYISPGASISTPVILSPVDNEDVGKDPKIIIPKINVEAPLVYGITGFEEHLIQDGLQDGVVHYANSAKPGEKGNAVYLGHSSNNGFNRGEYKYVFVLLFRLELDDTFVIHHEGTRYVYKVTNKQVIDPTDFSLIQPTKKPTVTLITCTPPGTSWKRLVIQAEQISPDPSEAKAATISEPIEADIVPSNAPSFWSEIWDSIF